MEDWRLTRDDDGIVTTAELRRAGLTPRAVEDLVRAGELTQLARGWYHDGPVDSAEDRHRLATKAMLRAHEGRVMAGHHSALILLELPTYRADLESVRLVRRSPGPGRTRLGQRVGRVVPVEAQRDETVAPALAVVQHGISAGPLSALVAADGALHVQRVTRDDLDRALEWVNGHPRTRMIQDFLVLADGRRESPGETRLAHLFHLMRVSVTPQFAIDAAAARAVVDFLVDGEMVVVEFDGRVKYQRSADEPDPYGRRRSPDQVVWDEKLREDRIRDVGYEVVRVVWSELDDGAAVGRRVAAAVRRSRQRHGRRVPA